MNMRERMLAVVQGREHDRVPFIQYIDMAAPNEEIWSMIGRDNLGSLRWAFPYRVETPNCNIETVEFEQNGRRAVKTVLHTPKGHLTQEMLFEPTFDSGSVRKHFVTDAEDYLTLMAYLHDMQVYADFAKLDEVRADLGDDGLPHVSVYRTPYQQLWVQWVSLADLSFHMADYPDLVGDCMEAIGSVLTSIIEIVCKSDAPYVVFPDNITAPTIGEKNFRQYCIPYYRSVADTLADRGIPVYVHMDGDLKPLWKAIGESGVGGLDSFSPTPDNDTSVAEAHSMWPEMRLGVNFPSSIHLASPEVIYDTAAQIIKETQGSGRLQIQITENVPPGVWKKSFPQIVRAIRDFGIYH